MKKIIPLIVCNLVLAGAMAGNVSAQTQSALEGQGARAGQETVSVDSSAEKTLEAVQEMPKHSSKQSAEDRVAVLNELVVQEGDSIRDGVVVGGVAEINGTVEGDLVMVLSKGTLGPSARIKGDLVLVGTQLDIDPAATVGGDRVIVGSVGTNLLNAAWLKIPQAWLFHGALLGRPLPHQFAWAWIIAALGILVYLLAMLLFPQQVQMSVESLNNQPGKSFLFGLLALVLFMPVLILLAVTGVGLLLVPFVIFAAIVIHIFGKAAVYAFAGQQLGQQFHVSVFQKPVVGLLVGAVLFTLLYTIPVLGFLVWALVLPLGIGGVIQALAVSASQRSNGTVSSAMPPMPATLSASIPGEAGTALIHLPRAGFWLRTLATLLDLVLVGIFCAALHCQEWFLLAWVAYHVGFWAWKGTTVGGILVGLKVIRADGMPLNFAVALVRSLASFFSFLVLGLGFFWVGWTPEKLSWHDKITDTLIVRLPKGASALYDFQPPPSESGEPSAASVNPGGAG